MTTTQKTTSRRSKAVKTAPQVSEAVETPQSPSEGKNEGTEKPIAPPAKPPRAKKPTFKVGDRVRPEDHLQSAWKILKIDGAIAHMERLPSGFKNTWMLAGLKRWELDYYPEQWIKVKGEVYPLLIERVNHADRSYQVVAASWLGKDAEKTIAQSAIECAVLEPTWLELDDGDRVIAKLEAGYMPGIILDSYSDADTLEVKVAWDSGETGKIQLQELQPFESEWRVGDRVTEDINTENAYKEGWASEINRTHGAIVAVEKSSGKFYPQIKKADGSLCMVNPDCLKPYEGDEPLSEPEPAEPSMTAEQVIEAMERAMSKAVEPEEAIAADHPQSSDISEPQPIEAPPTEHPSIEPVLEILRVHSKAQQWLISLYHLGKLGFVRGTDLMDLLSRNGRYSSDSSAQSDRVLSVLEESQVIGRGKTDLTGSLGHTIAGFKGLEEGAKIGDYPKDYAWGWGTNFEAVIAALKQADAIAEVEQLTLTTPPPIALDLQPGDRITTSSGSAIVTAIELSGHAQIIHANYGGVDQPHRPEDIEINDTLSHNEPAALSVEVLPTDAEIEALHRSLVDAEQQAEAALSSATQRYFELGTALNQVRSTYKRGSWLPWLEARGIHKKRAERSMAIAEKFRGKNDRLSFLSIQQALEQARLPAIEEYTFQEVAELYSSLPNTRFIPQRNGTFRYAIEIPGKTWLMRSTDEAFNYFPEVKKWIEAAKSANTCDRCQHCETLNESWYCHKRGEAYDPEENPAVGCKQYLPVSLGHLTREEVVEQRSQLPLDTASGESPGDLPNVAKTADSVNLSSVAIAAPSEMPVAAPKPAIKVDADRFAAEQFILQFGAGLGMDAIAIKILSWCTKGELEVVEEWMQQRRSAA